MRLVTLTLSENPNEVGPRVLWWAPVQYPAFPTVKYVRADLVTATVDDEELLSEVGQARGG